MVRILIVSRAPCQNIAGKPKIIPFTGNYMHVVFQIQGLWRKEKKLKSLLKGSLVVLKSFGGQRNTGSNINGIQDQILSQTPTETIT